MQIKHSEIEIMELLQEASQAAPILRSLFKTPIGPLCGGIKYFGVKRFS